MSVPPKGLMAPGTLPSTDTLSTVLKQKMLFKFVAYYLSDYIL